MINVRQSRSRIFRARTRLFVMEVELVEWDNAADINNPDVSDDPEAEGRFDTAMRQRDVCLERLRELVDLLDEAEAAESARTGKVVGDAEGRARRARGEPPVQRVRRLG